MPVREQGIVKWYNDETGCGFIMRSNDAGDAYVCKAQLRQHGAPLYDGQHVDFIAVMGRQLTEAHDVVVLS